MKRLFLGALVLSLACLAVADPDAPPRTVILDTVGFWRMHHTLEAPVVALPGGPQPVQVRPQWMRSGTPPPSPNWADLEFDDGAWLRAPARMAGRTPFLERLCLRGYFNVADPAAVQDLRLDLAYRGGVIVRLNGRELGRAHLPAGGGGGSPGLAETYPEAAFARDASSGPRHSRPGGSVAEPLAPLRERSLSGMLVPAALLRKGRNVLAIEVVRAPYHEIVDQKKRPWANTQMYHLAFNTCELKSVRLSAADARGATPAAVRLPGVQVWNTNLPAADFDLDFGNPAEPLRPLRIVAARGGRFSAKLAMGSDAPLVQPRAESTELRGPGRAVIPPTRVQIRYGLPGGGERGAYYGMGMDNFFGVTAADTRYPRRPTLLGALAESPPAEVSVQNRAPGSGDLQLPGQPEPVFGAVLPVWVTVAVPADAPPGAYHGTVRLEANGRRVAELPLHVAVTDYRLPATPGQSSWVELIQSPDTLALEYGLDLWSDAHFRLIARSMAFLGEVGCDTVYLPAIAQTNQGNAESMVRWIPRGGGRYDFDFTVFDRYLDTALRHQGRPQVVCVPVWEIYMGDATGYKDEYSHNLPLVAARSRFVGKGPLVTVLDPATGATTTDHLPHYSEPGMREVWTRFFAALRERLRRRGLEEALMLGQMSDHWPDREESRFFDEVSGGLSWVSHSHIGVPESGKYSYGSGGAPGGRRTMDLSHMRVGYFSAVFNHHMADNDPPLGSHRGWRNENLNAYQPRYEYGQPASRWRHIVELNVTGRQRGIARGGADYWVVLKDRHGRRSGRVHDRYPHSAWRNLDIVWNLLEPGPDGPVATHFFEAFREGIQETEARIFIERALDDAPVRARLGEDLARRCEAYLVQRTHRMLKAVTHLQLRDGGHPNSQGGPLVRQGAMSGHAWFSGSDWQDQSRILFGLAGEVQRRTE